MFHHVQLACPPGSEAALRGFYRDVLGMREKPKPPTLAGRGGCWFTGMGVEFHLGVDADFRAARKAHPAVLLARDALAALASRVESAGYPVSWSNELPGMRRFYTEDPHGNRLEFLAALD